MNKKQRILLSTLCLYLAGCSSLPKDFGTPTNPVDPEDVVEAPSVNRNIEERDKRAMDILIGLNKQEFTEFIHPEKGVRLTPYTYVQPETDQKFSRENMQKTFSNTGSVIWGTQPGSGDPIELTAKEYFQKYVTDDDYMNAFEVNWNKKVERGNSIDNAQEQYPDAEIIEFFQPGTEQYGGMDWHSLRLVLEEYEGLLFLVGIIHDSWTP